MAEDLPQSHLSSSFSSSTRQFLPVWMKSLVMNGNGCTVYDSNGLIVYRVDNYAYRCSNEVYLMDCDGRTLTKIIKKKLKILDNGKATKDQKWKIKIPCFESKRPLGFLEEIKVSRLWLQLEVGVTIPIGIEREGQWVWVGQRGVFWSKKYEWELSATKIRTGYFPAFRLR